MLSLLKAAPKDRLEQWLQDLESLPAERQTTDRYYTEDGCMCALGVGIVRAQGLEPRAFTLESLQYWGFRGLRRWLELTPDQGEAVYSKIITMNDTLGMSFVEIAREIRRATA